MSEQMDWRQAAAARGLKVSDLAEHVGTSIEGIDLGDEHDAEMVAIIRAACVERTLLLFRGQQQLDPAAYLAFACRFGGRPTCTRSDTIACPTTTRSSWSATCTRSRQASARRASA